MKKIIFLLIILFCSSSCRIGRSIYYNTANITDYTIFPNREIKNDSTRIFYFKNGLKKNFISEIPDGISFEKKLKKNKTVAFLVIHNDTIKYEKYFNKYNRESIVASFSMAKSFTSFLIGCAIDDGYINSVKDPVTRYIPELKENGFHQVTVENLLQMTSGLNFNESYFNPFGHAAAFYYGKNLEKSSLKLKLKNKPGESATYMSGNTQLLGLILHRALKGKTISKYLEEKLWSKIGMEFDTSWSLDKKEKGIEKTFCCLNARAIDFAKFGRLYLKKGNWNGKQIVSKDWVEKSIERDTLNGSSGNYQYQWWIPNKKGDFMAKGILGQFVFVSPSENLVIVRLGKRKGTLNWTKTFEKIKEIVKNK